MNHHAIMIESQKGFFDLQYFAIALTSQEVYLP
jgi:hypothetical protein